ncbi:MAG: SPFH domain-containing protein [Phycisphaerae bacterium]
MAGLGLAVGLAGFITFALLGRSNLSLATYATGWLLLGSVGIWALIWVRLHQVRLLAREKQEVAELERERRERLRGAGSVFSEQDADQMEALSMGRRLQTLERWFIPVLALATAAGLTFAGVRFLPGVLPWQFAVDAAAAGARNASMMAFFAGATAFITFAISRYALGMSRVASAADWTPLRAGGAYFFGVAITSLALAVALILAHNGYADWERRVAVAVGGLMVLLAAEIAINFVLDFYRPRVAGQPQRVFYESRVLGVFCEPEGIIRSVAHTIDYQFGFKVSETWFYQLLGRVIVPLLIFQALVLVSLTCLVVVPQGYEAVVEVTPPWGTGYRWVATPGVGLSWPWPVARTTLIPVERVQRMELGYDRAAEKPRDKAKLARWQLEQMEVTLWTQRHRVREYQLLVADRRASADTKVPVNLLSVTMPVHWRVKPDKALEFYKQSDRIGEIIEALAYRELTRYAAHADLLDMIGSGGIEAAQQIRASLQAACDRGGAGQGDLGVEIVYVGVGGVHPPTDVAEAYENVVVAYEQRDTKIKQALTDAGKIQILAAGEKFQQIYDAIISEDAARNAGGDGLEARTAAVDQLIRNGLAGDAREVAAAAEEYLYRRVTLEGASAELFKIQRLAYARAPRVYKTRAYLRTLVDGMADVQKYIVAVSHPERVLYQLDVKPPPPLETLSQEIKSFQESGGK